MQTLGTGAGNLNFLFQIGSARYITFTFVESDGSATDISLWTFELFLKKFKGDRVKTLSLTLGDGLSFPVYEENNLLATFSTSDSSIEEGEYYIELRRTDENIPLVSGLSYFSFDAPAGDINTVTITSGSQTISITLESGFVSSATQSQVNAGTATGVYVSPSTLSNKDAGVVALVDGATIDLTGEKHTLATSRSAITFTNSFIGDGIFLEIVLSATSSTLTFPSGYLCQVGGTASGDNTSALSGTSGDRYVVSIIKFGSQYYVGVMNMKQ